MKHAYLILAHNEFGLLQTLISCLDDARNDIFVHIDRKVASLPELWAENAGLFVLEDRVNVFWGDFSVVEAEYKLLEASAMNDEYEYYHIISGVDLPLKSQDEIHRFFERNRGKEFLGFSTYDTVDEVRRKVNRWHLFPHDFKNKSAVKKVLRAGFIRLQEVFHLTRNKDYAFRKGTQWASLTDGFVRTLIANKSLVRKLFTHTFCADEIYKQTICWNTGFRQNVFDMGNEGHGCMRAIGWKNNSIVDWDRSDYEELRDSDAMFARKFNSKDPGFIQSILALSKK